MPARDPEAVGPLREGERLRLSLGDLAAGGEAVARHQGMAVFVAGGAPGDIAQVEITHLARRFARGRVVEIVEPGPSRVQPPCSYFGRCGGCQLQHIAYDEQLRQKQIIAVDALQRIGRLGDIEMAPIIGMDHPWRCRNKAEYAVANTPQGLALGFLAAHSHQVVPLDDCPLQHPLSVELMRAFPRAARDTGWLDQWERGPQPVAYLVTRVSAAHNQALATIIFPAHAGQPQRLAHQLIEMVPQLVGVTAAPTKRGLRSPSARSRPLVGEWAIEETLGDLRLRVSADSFFQVNTTQAERLVDLVLEWSDPRAGETAVDAYCGVGLFLLALAKRGARVMGIESNASAVRDARANARRAGLKGIRMVHGKAERLLPMLARRRMRADIVVLDPPRGGCPKAALAGAAAMRPRLMLLISCDPATLARDLRVLADLGYRSDRIQPLDVFPHSHHIEVAARLIPQGTAD